MSFWAEHGYLGGFFFILFLFLLPRITMFISLALTVGIAAWIMEPFGLVGHPLIGAPVVVIGWIAWLLFPRFLVAALATALYFETNTVLVIVAWLAAYFIFISKKEIAEERARKRTEETLEAERLAAEEVAAQRKKRARSSGTQQGQQHRRPAQSSGQRAQQWWEVLGVSPGASADAIKSAYHRIAKATHPDSAPDGKGNVEKFRKATEAYDKGTKRNGK